MQISEQLAADMRWLVKDEEWGETDRQLARDCLKKDPAFFGHFFTVYVAARKKGYRMLTGTGYMRLAEFCAFNDLPDPYRGDKVAAQWDQGGRQ